MACGYVRHDMSGMSEIDEIDTSEIDAVCGYVRHERDE